MMHQQSVKLLHAHRVYSEAGWAAIQGRGVFIISSGLYCPAVRGDFGIPG